MDGQKDITLVDPVRSLEIYKDFGEQEQYTPMQDWSASHAGTSSGSTVDLRAYPSAAAVPVETVLLSPGDLLLMPNRWWHLVDSLKPARGHRRNLALTFQAGLPYPPHMRDESRAFFSYEMIDFSSSWRAAAADGAVPLEGLPPELRSCPDAEQARALSQTAIEDLEELLQQQLAAELNEVAHVRNGGGLAG